MRKLVLPLAAVMALGFCVKFSHAADNDKSSEKEKKITGVLIDEKCAGKFTSQDNPQKAAAKHPASCAKACAGKGEKLVLLHGKDELKLDEHGQELAKAYLDKSDAKTLVTITGEREGDEIKVSSIDPAKRGGRGSSEKSESSEK